MENTLSYKGHQVLRKGSRMYIGDLSQKYIVEINVLESEKQGDLDLATKLTVELQLNDPDISSTDKIVKSSQRVGLYEAMDLACIWLDRALSGK